MTIEIDCLGQKATAICDQIRTVDKSRLRKSAGKLTETDLASLEDGLRQVLCL